MNQRFFVCIILLALVFYTSFTYSHKVELDEDELAEQELLLQKQQEATQDTSSEETIQIPQLSPDHVPINRPFSYYLEHYMYEFYTIGFLVMAFLLFFKGKSANDSLAQRWKRACNETISQNFAHFGTTKEPSAALDKLSYNEYHYYASGRQNCLFALYKIDLKKRQCIFSTLTLEMIWPKKDQVFVEIPIKASEYYLSDGTATTNIPLELIICKKRDMKTFFSTYPVLKSMVGPVKVNSLKGESDLIVLAESDEAANHVIDNQVGDILSKFGDSHIQEIHITDQKLFNNQQEMRQIDYLYSPLWLKATINIEDNEDKLKESARIVKLLLYIIDRVVTLRLSQSNRAKADKNRKAVEKVRQKEKQEENEEEVLKKKREKDQKFQEKLKSLPPEQQRKLEEKKREKDMAKQKKRMSKIMKF